MTMTDSDRIDLYSTLLRGMAKEAQDRLCAEDRSHAWGPWVRSVVQKDRPPMGPRNFAEASQETYRVRADRVCQNCGKEQMS